MAKMDIHAGLLGVELVDEVFRNLLGVWGKDGGAQVLGDRDLIAGFGKSVLESLLGVSVTGVKLGKRDNRGAESALQVEALGGLNLGDGLSKGNRLVASLEGLANLRRWGSLVEEPENLADLRDDLLVAEIGGVEPVAGLADHLGDILNSVVLFCLTLNELDDADAETASELALDGLGSSQALAVRARTEANVGAHLLRGSLLDDGTNELRYEGQEVLVAPVADAKRGADLGQGCVEALRSDVVGNCLLQELDGKLAHGAAKRIVLSLGWNSQDEGSNKRNK